MRGYGGLTAEVDKRFRPLGLSYLPLAGAKGSKVNSSLKVPQGGG
jgi:hypothetical protein